MTKQLFNPVRKLLYGIGVLSLCSSFLCEESLPPRDLKDFLSPILRAPETADVFFNVERDTFMVGTGAFLSLGLKNNSDEYLQAKARIHGTLEVSSSIDPTFRRIFEFSVPEYNEVTIPPLAEFTVRVPWDQRDDSCRFVFRNAFFEEFLIGGRVSWYRTRTLLTFRIKGRVQIWPNVQTMDLPEITFHRRYYIGVLLGRSFKDLTTCAQFRSEP